MLYIFGGLPGTGKSTLARRLATHVRAVHLRIDTIEQAIRKAGGAVTGGEGYVVAYDLAADNLRLGLSVVADSVNPWALTRSVWRGVALNADVAYAEIEVICSDQAEHRRRVETRVTDVDGLKLPSWADVVNRDYHAWPDEHIVIDTAGQTEDESFASLLHALSTHASALRHRER